MLRVALPGFGYTEAPSVVVKGVGNGAGGCEIQTFIEIDTPAVRMGVATDQEGCYKIHYTNTLCIRLSCISTE